MKTGHRSTLRRWLPWIAVSRIVLRAPRVKPPSPNTSVNAALVNFRVSVAHEAEKILDRLDRPTEQRIRSRFIVMTDPLILGYLRRFLANRHGIRKSRVGGWRVLFFTVDREAKVIYILTVDTRGQVYKH